jgi:hypothetical protein
VKDVGEVARAGVADFECDLDQAARCFTDHLLRARDPLNASQTAAESCPSFP